MNPQSQNTFNLPPQPKKIGRTAIEIVLGILLVASVVFGAWSFMGKNSAQTNLDKQISDAVTKAKADQATTLQAKFDTDSKLPNKTFTGSATYGSVTFDYPKTWSGYLGSTNSGQPINAYFQPNLVPSVDGANLFALRVELLSTSYSDVVANFKSSISSGSVKASAYVPEKLKTTANVSAGLKLTGDVKQDGKSSGILTIMKVRDKTLKVYTESTDYSTDFNSIVLPSLTFAP